MLDSPDDFAGRITFVVGPGKGCGKTAFARRAACLARRGIAAYGSGGRAGPGLALLAVGYEGQARDGQAAARAPTALVEPGDVVVTTEAFGAPCSPELLDVVPGSTALGRLCVQRATRRASLALVGPEGNDLIAWTVRRIVDEGWADAAIIDGAADRLTPVASVPGARFVYAMRVDRAGLEAAARALRRIDALADLQLATGLPGGAFRLDGALTPETASRLPESARSVVVGDLSKVFLGAAELAAFTRRRGLFVERRVELAGFSIACQGLSDEEFLSALGYAPAAPVSFNPYEAAAGAA